MISYKALKDVDWLLLGLTLAISCISLFVLSSSGYDVKTHYSQAFVKQLIYVLVGIGLFLFCTFIRISVWRYWAYFFYFIICRKHT